MKTNQFDVLVVGGGLAGLCAAAHLAKEHLTVAVFEPKAYPRHKVCGEYISKEVLPYLNFLGLDPFKLGAVDISRFEWTHPKGNSTQTQLPLGGFGLSRYALEQALLELALSYGVQLISESAEQLESVEEGVRLQTKLETYHGRAGIAAYGKRASLDKKLGREFINKKANFMAAKWHAIGDFPAELVALHNFPGGYCGVSKVEDDRVNFCFIATYDSFKQHKEINSFIQQVLTANPHLSKLLQESEMVFDKPLSIAQISFKDKPPVEGHWLMCGDTAGLIHPLSGNGMSMAIRSAELASKEILAFVNNETSLRNMLVGYRRAWHSEFKKRLKIGRLAARVFGSPGLSQFAVNLFKVFPSLLPYFIKQTHGRLENPNAQ